MGKASTSNALSQWGGAQTAFNNYGNSVADLNDRVAPEQNFLDFSMLDKSMERQGILNSLNSRRVEQETTPQIAAARQGLESQIVGDLNQDQLPAMLQRQYANAGITDAISSGMGVGSSAGKSIVANTLGKGLIDWRNQNQQKAAALLSNNPLPITGLDPGSRASAQADQQTSNLNLRNAELANQNALRSQRYGDSFNGMQQMMSATAQQAQNNASAANTRSGQVIGALSSVAGALVGVAGAAVF